MASKSKPLVLQPQTRTTNSAETKAEADLTSYTRNGPFAVLRVPSFAWFLTGTTLTNAAQRRHDDSSPGT